MFHHWKVLFGRLVYCGQVPAPSPTYKPTSFDFLVEERRTPFTVYVRAKDQTLRPVFHARDENHARFLKSNYTLQPNEIFTTVTHGE